MINLNVIDNKDGDTNHVNVELQGDAESILQELGAALYAALSQVSAKTKVDYDTLKLIFRYTLTDCEETCGVKVVDDWSPDGPEDNEIHDDASGNNTEGIDNLINTQDYKK